MVEIMCYDWTLPGAYHQALCALDQEGEVTECSDWNCLQKEVSMTIIVEKPLEEPMISKMFIGGPRELEQYRMEMLDGILDFEIEKGNWTYTYHDRMTHYEGYPSIDCSNEGDQTYEAFSSYDKNVGTRFINQIDFVIHELKRNPSSRRAVIMIRDTEDIGSNDPACMQHIQYFIRDNRLHCKVLFRSNDATKATFMNMFALILLQEKIANELDVEVGSYTHRANSFHCYEKDFHLLSDYVKRIEETEEIEDLCFDYEGDWKEEMNNCCAEILQAVEILKER